MATVIGLAFRLYDPERLLGGEITDYGITTTFVDTADVAAVRAAIRPTTKLIYYETIANPSMKVAAQSTHAVTSVGTSVAYGSRPAAASPLASKNSANTGSASFVASTGHAARASATV